MPVDRLRNIGLIKYIDRDRVSLFQTQDRTWNGSVVADRPDDLAGGYLERHRSNPQRDIGGAVFTLVRMCVDADCAEVASIS